MMSYAQGVLEWRSVGKYDEPRRLISSEVILSDLAKHRHTYGHCGDCGLSSGRTIYKYDNSDRITDERIFQPGGQLVGLDLNSYDDDGNCTREWVYRFGPPQSEEQKTRVSLDGIDPWRPGPTLCQAIRLPTTLKETGSRKWLPCKLAA
jgi:hypothetical protein